MSQAKHYVAIDLGAESGRVMLTSVCEGKVDIEEMHRFPNGPVSADGSLRWDVDAIFGEICKGLKKTFATGKEIQSIGVDTWGVDFGLLDSDGELLEKPYHYRDSRTDGMIAAAAEIVPRKDIYMNTGIQFMQFNSLFQLLALKSQRPAVLEKTEVMLFMANLIMYMLTGRIGAEYTLASTSQMVDMQAGVWSRNLLEMLELPQDILPAIEMPGTPAGAIKPVLAAELGCGAVPVVNVGTHDTASAVAAVPARHGRDWAYLSSGTWSLMGLEMDEPVIDDRSFGYGFTNEGGVENTIRLLKNIMGLWLVQECRRQWASEGEDLDYGQIAAMAAGAEPFVACVDPDHGPFLSPGDMPAKINRFLQSTGQPRIDGKGQMIRAVLESLAVRYRQVLDMLEELSARKIDILHIVGGGTQNELLNQLTADATGRTVLTGPIEATVLGNVLVQAKADGAIADIDAGRELVAQSFPLKRYRPSADERWTQFSEKFATIQKGS